MQGSKTRARPRRHVWLSRPAAPATPLLFWTLDTMTLSLLDFCRSLMAVDVMHSVFVEVASPRAAPRLCLCRRLASVTSLLSMPDFAPLARCPAVMSVSVVFTVQ